MKIGRESDGWHIRVEDDGDGFDPSAVIAEAGGRHVGLTIMRERADSVSGRVKVGEVGFTIEFGRPGVGARFHEIQKMSQTLARAGVSFEKKNPVTSLMSDVATGTIREDILNEKVMSAILEIKVPVERTEEVIRLVWQIEKEISTVVALGVGTRCDENGEENVVAPILERLGADINEVRRGIGHDARIGNGVVISNNVMIAGHVICENNVAVMGGVGIHHFVTIGESAYIGAY